MASILPSGWTLVKPPSLPSAIAFFTWVLAKVPRVMMRSLPRREP
jgi:hypothetical protein